MVAQGDDPVEEAVRQWEHHGWGDAAAGMAAVTRLVRLNQVLMADIEALLRPRRLTFARFEVLRLLAFAKSGELAMGRLGTLLQVRPASVSNVVERLEAEGFVERTANPADGRSTIARILPAGRQVLEPATAELNEAFRALGSQPAFAQLGGLLREVLRHHDSDR